VEITLNWAEINEMSLNWFDWVVILILTISTLLSLWRGFAKEALSLAAWVAAFVVATVFADSLAAQLSGVIDNVTGRYMAAYALLFVATLVLGTVLNALVARLIKLTGLSTLDRLLGTLFGFTRGLIIVLVIVFAAQELLPAQNQQVLLESEIMPHLELIAHWMRSLFAQVNTNWGSGISV
jgi:membrane protein required for colicin V production